jgi:hypothetical protein
MGQKALIDIFSAQKHVKNKRKHEGDFQWLCWQVGAETAVKMIFHSYRCNQQQEKKYRPEINNQLTGQQKSDWCETKEWFIGKHSSKNRQEHNGRAGIEKLLFADPVQDVHVKGYP